MLTSLRFGFIFILISFNVFGLSARADDNVLPLRLSELGLFSDLHQLTPAANVYSYSVNFPLWSDGAATKQRWVYLPPNSKINFQADSPWLIADGTILVKQINFESRVETRVEIKTSHGWRFAAYLWNSDQSDAIRVDTSVQVQVTSPFSQSKVAWTVPAKDKCLMCHISSRTDSEVIGFNTTQFGKAQLQDWVSRNLFNSAPTPDSIDHFSYFPDVRNADHVPIPNALFARAYLAVNCSTCHRPGAFVPTPLDFTWTTRLDSMNAVGVSPSFGNLGIPNAKIIFRGSHNKSLVWARMNTTNSTHMPYFGTRITDPVGLAAIANWIDTLGN